MARNLCLVTIQSCLDKYCLREHWETSHIGKTAHFGIASDFHWRKYKKLHTIALFIPKSFISILLLLHGPLAPSCNLLNSLKPFSFSPCNLLWLQGTVHNPKHHDIRNTCQGLKVKIIFKLELTSKCCPLLTKHQQPQTWG